jgi:hypothetical protein
MAPPVSGAANAPRTSAPRMAAPAGDLVADKSLDEVILDFIAQSGTDPRRR